MSPRSLGCWCALLVITVCFPAHAIELRFKPKVGLETKHKLMISARVETASETEEGDSEQQRSEATARIEFTRKALSETDDETLMETRCLSAKVNLKADDKTEEADLGPYRSVVHMNRQHESGEVEEAEGDDPPEAEGDNTCGTLSSLQLGCGMWASLLEELRLPAEAVEPGAIWKHEGSLSEVGDHKIAFTYKLEELTSVSGRKCARIRVTWRNQWQLKESDLKDLLEEDTLVGLGDTEGIQTGDLVWLYNYENSVDVLVEGSIGHETTNSAFSSTEKVLMNLKLALVE